MPQKLYQVRKTIYLMQFIDKFYWYSNRFAPQIADKNECLVFNIDAILVYHGFNKDFGPLNLAQVHRYCEKVSGFFSNGTNQQKQQKSQGFKVIHHCSTHFQKQANACFLLCAYQIICLNRTSDQAWAPFKKYGLQLIPYLDAGDQTVSVKTFEITVLQCLRGLEAARDLGWYNYDTFNPEEYESIYDSIDCNWVIPLQICALSSPISSTYKNYHSGFLNKNITITKTIETLKRLGVKHLIRLNEPLYNDKIFMEKWGIKVHDMEFPDGSCPDMVSLITN